MTRRILFGFIAILIIMASFPVYALGPDPTVPGYIIERRKLDSCNADSNNWLSGYIETAPAIVTDAVSRLSTDSPGVVPDMAVITTTSSNISVKLLYVPAATTYSYSNLGINSSNNTWPYLRGYGNSLTEYNVYKFAIYVYTGTYDDPVFSRRQSLDGNQASQFLMSGDVYIRYAAPWAVNWSGTVPDDTCTGQVSVTPGYIAFDSPTTPPGPGYSGPAFITLQPGNLLIFQRDGGFIGVPDIRILADNLPRSPLIGPWTTRNTIKSFDSLPDPTSVFVLPYLEWTAVPGTTDWLGRSSVGTSSWQISQYTDDYAVFLNPIFGTDVSGGLLGDSSADYNPPNKIFIQEVSDYDRIMLVPVVNRYGQSFIDYDNGSVLYDVSFTDDGSPEYTPDGSDTPSSDANRPGGATDITGTPGGTTQGLIARILEFLESGIDRFSSIADAGRSFIESIGGMFSWLPIEVRTVIISGIIIVIMMGVLSRFI